MGDGKPATIYDVAARAGVSKSLVSLVLQRSPRVSDQRRAAVLKAIQELDYRPSTAAVSLAGTRSRTIGVVLDDFRNQWFVDLLTGLRESLQDQGHRLVVADRFLNTGLDASPVEGFLSMRVEGIVIAGEPTTDLAIPASMPLVIAGGRVAIPRADTVANDDHAGGGIAAQHLLDLGHTRLGFVGASSAASAERQSGFEQAAATRASVVTTVLPGEPTEEAGSRALGMLLDEHPDVTAVFAANDVMALGALSELAERGLRVPEDVSVIGYDDTPVAAMRYVGLTSIDDRSVEIGRGAGERLLARIADPRIAATELLVEPRLVARRTTAAR
ncbi:MULTISPECIES: LacI family DNA-binding transcriptional regulator [Curtobacterium]|jgi:DNA-binding LacI/PurR family transcriptional regulator|uniref:LacI family DNA-binding transcriptional regulator n=1 Tax=Curtobacterium TaxID=2034 RepID=UPI000DA6EE4A|nr:MULTISPECIES: LacI family DNA-binding transcriptional regulator [Curtobacterium]MBF4628072.1 LacI family DNA-binding transcriptional regulator [Curtobacterium flaccumfaciens]MBO9042249.1 LacI family DNA-binding transcriptional regulator [Curtobacterium flaccumfaciens pv. flaccumfaciens]MBT1684037.1 LacI family transcriptional regulator [Curtobacterium flaccumfaciens pv. flaccumfaciens]MCS6550328.1 LacI family transcriptional regulator [Curtobacterium flaccumfaciens pv. flaccumfaciens]PZF421